MCHYLATVEGVPIFLWGNLEDDSRTRRERGEESSCSADWDWGLVREGVGVIRG